MLVALEFFESGLAGVILWIQLERLLIVLNREILSTCCRICLAQAVVHIPRGREQAHICLE